ncbi:MAG TPA: Holliday junction branch migration protein RuvA [Candidatus Angelobacter sp.]|nr:Holliday junction branch migration protein RuvA [Candidatus Angelobacter sp.]
MYEFIEGTIANTTVDSLVMANNGIGYLIYCPNPYQFKVGEQTIVYTYLYVREDAMHLYGFKSREERQLFVQLLSVSGIGPKGALAILATGTPGRVVEAIELEDERYLVQFPGVGKKTARQIILDLKGKFKGMTLSTPTGSERREDEVSSVPSALQEATLALKALGYSEKEIDRIIPSLKTKEMTTEAYIKAALQLMLKG